MQNHIALVNKPKQNKKYSIIIPCAGIGSRMKYNGPKSLLSLGEETILERQIRIIHKTFRLSEIIIVCGFNGEKIEEYVISKKINGVKCVNNTKYESTNVAYSINLGLNEVSRNGVLVINGDLVFSENLLNSSPLGYHSMVLVDDPKCSKMPEREIGCTQNNHKLEYLMYDLKPKWCQIAYFQDLELELLKQELKNISSNVKYSFELINDIIKVGGIFNVHNLHNVMITDVDKVEDLSRAKEICK